MAETPISYVTVPSGRRPLSPPDKTDVLGGVEERLSQLAGGLARQRGVELAEEQRVERVRIENEALSVMESARLEARKAPRSSEVQRIYDEKTRPIADLLDQLPDEEKPLFQAFVARRGLAHMADLETTRSQMLARETQVVANEKLEGLKTAAANGTDADLQESLDQLGVFYAEQVGAGTLNEATAEAAIALGRRQIQASYATGLLQRGSYWALNEALGSGSLDALTSEDVARIQSSARNGESDTLVTDIQIQLEDGANPDAMRNRILGLRKADKLTEADTRQALNMVNAAKQKGQDVEDLSRAAALFDAVPGYIDPTLTPKQKQTLLRGKMGEFAQSFAITHPDATERDLSVGFIQKYGQLPEDLFLSSSAKVFSNSDEGRIEGINDLVAYETAFGGRMGDVMPGATAKALKIAHRVHHKMLGGPPGAEDLALVPAMSMQQAIAQVEREDVNATDGSATEDAMDAWRSSLLKNPQAIADSLAHYQNGIKGLFAGTLGIGKLDAADVPPGILSALAGRVAFTMSEERKSPDGASEDDVQSAIETAALELYSSAGLGVSSINGRPSITLMPPERVLASPVDVDEPTLPNLGHEPYRVEAALSIAMLAAERASDPRVAGAFRAGIERMTDPKMDTLRAYLKGNQPGVVDLLPQDAPLGVVLGVIEGALREAGLTDAQTKRPTDLAWRTVNEALGLPPDVRWEPEMHADSRSIADWKAGGAPYHVLLAAPKDGGSPYALMDPTSDITGPRPLTIQFANRSDFISPILREQPFALSDAEATEVLRKAEEARAAKAAETEAIANRIVLGAH